jgi:nucleotide-binding universal stress UspA family protein
LAAPIHGLAYKRRSSPLITHSFFLKATVTSNGGFFYFKARKDHNRMPVKNILVAIQFEHPYQALLDWARGLGQHYKAKLWLLHVAAPDPDFVGYEAGPQYIRDDRAAELKSEHQLLAKMAKQLEEEGLDCTALLVSGATAETIITEAGKVAAHLLIIGQSEKGFWEGLLMGDTAKKIMEESAIPTLVVPLN